MFPPAPNDQGWHLRQILAPLAWATGTTGAGVRIGQLDTGVVRSHPELAGATILTGFDVIRGTAGATDPGVVVDPLDPGDVPGHGTATASVIVSAGGIAGLPPPLVRGGTTGPGVITGVAPGATLEPFRVITSVVVILGGNVASGLFAATASGCDVITMSLGGFPSVPLHLALVNAVMNDVIVVAAAGNFAPLVVFPAAHPECIAVAGTNVLGLPFIYSSRGPGVDIAAPAERVWVAWPPRGVAPSIGTSFAAPCVASIAALWLSANGGRAAVLAVKGPAPLQEIFRSLLANTAIPFPVPPRSIDPLSPFWMGPGIANALALATARLPPPPVLPAPPAPPPPPPPPGAAIAPAAVAPAPTTARTIDIGRSIFDWLARMLVTTDAGARTLLGSLLTSTERDLDRLVERYGLELLHILMTTPTALSSLRTAGERLEKNADPSSLLPSAFAAIRKAASKTLAAALRVPPP